jgi:MFS family permease
MQKIQTACCLMQIVGLLAAGFSSNLLLIGAGAVVLAMGAGLIMATSYSQLGGMRGKKGKISAFFFLIVGTGITVGPVYSGYLSSLYGIRAAFTGFIPVEIAALCFIAWRWSMEGNMAVNHYRRVVSSEQENKTALVD